MNQRLSLVCLLCAACAWGSPTPADSSQPGGLGALPDVHVQVGEAEIQDASLPEGCVGTVGQLPRSYLYRADDPILDSDALIVVLKQARRLMLFQGGTLHNDLPDGTPACWRIALGVGKDGRPSDVFDKRMQGDRRTPEGLFRTSDKPWSSYYGAILIHYPSSRHARQAYNSGRVKKSTLDQIARAELAGTAPPQTTSLGGDILIHGGGSSADWTWGCVAMDDHDIDELRSLLPKGMKTWVLILP